MKAKKKSGNGSGRRRTERAGKELERDCAKCAELRTLRGIGGGKRQGDQQVADIGFHLKVIESFSISLHSLGLLRSHLEVTIILRVKCQNCAKNIERSKKINKLWILAFT